MARRGGFVPWQTVSPLAIVAVSCMLSSAVLASRSLGYDPTSITVCTPHVIYQGSLSDHDPTVSVFRGIKFGQAERWKSPLLYEAGASGNSNGDKDDADAEASWLFPFFAPNPSIYDATRYRASCPQITNVPLVEFSEDCLHLNIFRPRGIQRQEPLPVVVFIAGGGFVRGSGSDPDYDGSKLVAARSGAIFVAIHYRVGPFGFLSLPHLSAESGHRNTSGMYGFEDQRLALQWIRRNIHLFGGDPQRIVLMGHSAGSISVCMHMVSPMSSGLFHAAILQSGGCDVVTQSVAHRYDIGAIFLQQSPCALSPPSVADANDSLACLRNLPTGAVMNLTVAVGADIIFSPTQFQPGVDGFNIPVSPNVQSIAERMAMGAFHPVPSLIGYTVDETSLFVASQPGWMNVNETTFSLFAPLFSLGNPLIEQFYHPTKFQRTEQCEPARTALIRLSSEALFICPSRRMARAIADRGVPVWMYSFGHAPLDGALSALKWTGAYHYSDVPFAFGMLPDAAGFIANVTAEELELSRRMQHFWLNFIETAGAGRLPNPNIGLSDHSESSFVWPPYSRHGDEILFLSAAKTLPIGRFPYAEGCALFDLGVLANVPHPHGYKEVASAASVSGSNGASAAAFGGAGASTDSTADRRSWQGIASLSFASGSGSGSGDGRQDGPQKQTVLTASVGFVLVAFAFALLSVLKAKDPAAATTAAASSGTADSSSVKTRAGEDADADAHTAGESCSSNDSNDSNKININNNSSSSTSSSSTSSSSSSSTSTSSSLGLLAVPGKCAKALEESVAVKGIQRGQDISSNLEKDPDAASQRSVSSTSTSTFTSTSTTAIITASSPSSSSSSMDSGSAARVASPLTAAASAAGGRVGSPTDRLMDLTARKETAMREYQCLLLSPAHADNNNNNNNNSSSSSSHQSMRARQYSIERELAELTREMSVLRRSAPSSSL